MDDDKRLLDALKKLRPTAVRFTLDDGKQQRMPIKARAGAKRVEWSAVVKNLSAYDWTMVELLGKGDDVLGVVSTEQEDTAPEGESHIERVLRLCNDHADRAVQRHIEALGPTLDVAFKQVAMLGEALIQERKDNRAQSQVTHKLAEELAEKATKVQKGEEQPGELVGLLTQLPNILPAVQAVMSMLGDGDAAPKPKAGSNGHAKPKPPIDVT